MPDFKHLAEGEKPADPEKYILIEVIHEPAIGDQYRVTGKGLGPTSTIRRFHGLHAGSGAQTGSGVGQGRERANHLPEQRHCPYRDVIRWLDDNGHVDAVDRLHWRIGHHSMNNPAGPPHWGGSLGKADVLHPAANSHCIS
jgi:hypothetical protein